MSASEFVQRVRAAIYNISTSFYMLPYNNVMRIYTYIHTSVCLRRSSCSERVPSRGSGSSRNEKTREECARVSVSLWCIRSATTQN